MLGKLKTRPAMQGCVTAFLIFSALESSVANEPVACEQMLQLQRQNELLQQRLRNHQELADSLSNKVSEIPDLNTRRDREMNDLKTSISKDDAATQSSQMKDIVVPEQGDVKADFTLGITGPPKP
jgi:hypothetical protein